MAIFSCTCRKRVKKRKNLVPVEVSTPNYPIKRFHAKHKLNTIELIGILTHIHNRTRKHNLREQEMGEKSRFDVTNQIDVHPN